MAVRTALAHPERLAALVLVAPVLGGGVPFPDWQRALLATPHGRRLGLLFVRGIAAQGEGILRRSWHDPSRITRDVIAGYLRPLQAQDWDRALLEVAVSARPGPALERLGQINVPVLLIAGSNDRTVPRKSVSHLGERIPGAELVVLPSCGHLPHEEQPGQFLEAVGAFLVHHGLLSGKGIR